MVYTKENLQEAILHSNTFSDVVRFMRGYGGKVHGGVVSHVGKLISKYELDISHFAINRWAINKNKSSGKSYSKDEFELRFLVKDSPFISTSNLKSKLVKFGYLKYECTECGNNGEWNNKKLTLQLDHENGDSTDNRLINLKIKCPNCHSQTETYSGKNNRKK